MPAPMQAKSGGYNGIEIYSFDSGSDMKKQHHLSHTQSQNGQGRNLRQSLQSIWTSVTNFMVLRSPISSEAKRDLSQHSYNVKAGLYPYLPPSEEQRDWLGKVYDQS